MGSVRVFTALTMRLPSTGPTVQKHRRPADLRRAEGAQQAAGRQDEHEDPERDTKLGQHQGRDAAADISLITKRNRYGHDEQQKRHADALPRVVQQLAVPNDGAGFATA